MQIEPLKDFDLATNGVLVVDNGIKIVVFSHLASAVFLCLIDELGQEPKIEKAESEFGVVQMQKKLSELSGNKGQDVIETQIPLFGHRNGKWHAFISGIKPGQRYGFRVGGDFEPRVCKMFNENKFLLDPYAKGLTSTVELSQFIFPYPTNENYEPIVPIEKDESQDNSSTDIDWFYERKWHADKTDSLPYMPQCVVIDNSQYSTEFNWQDSKNPHTQWEKSFIYEAHVKSLTINNLQIPAEHRGTYLGACNPAVLGHLKNLGITAIEFLPIHISMTEPLLSTQGKVNYWGYNSLNYFYPNPKYATLQAQENGPQAVIDELKTMVCEFHKVGIEVILDVVYNHTCEGKLNGVQVSWRGLGDTTYYLSESNSTGSSESSDMRHYIDYTWCGNSVNYKDKTAISMMQDSLRYWVKEFKIDGFRYDLATTSARDNTGYNPNHPTHIAMLNDPILRMVKHIAEPWDMGPYGYQVAGFPAPIATWNDQFRIKMKNFWLLDYKNCVENGGFNRNNAAGELVNAIDGSSYLYMQESNATARSVNYVVSHDGFTLADSVSYNDKHNEANLENNQDGSNDNNNYNFGKEEYFLSTDSLENQQIAFNRRKSIRNLLGSLVIACGTPMLCSGDEIGNTQQGNNNAYCQDSNISFLDWSLDKTKEDLYKVCSRLIKLRNEIVALRPAKFENSSWFTKDGVDIPLDCWDNPNFRTLQMIRYAKDCNVFGSKEIDSNCYGSTVVVLINGSLEKQEYNFIGSKLTNNKFELVFDSTSEVVQEPVPLQHVQNENQQEQVVAVEPMSMQIYVSTGN